jgi:hypothetical protein
MENLSAKYEFQTQNAALIQRGSPPLNAKIVTVTIFMF